MIIDKKKLVMRFYTFFGISCHVMIWFLIAGGWQLWWRDNFINMAMIQIGGKIRF